MSEIINPQTIIFALTTGFLPVIIWLIFWLREDRKKPEPKSLILITFVLGMIGVFIAYFLEIQLQMPDLSAISQFNWSTIQPFFNMALVEELVKFLIFAFIIGRNRHLDEPIDAMIYMITVALGFASMENVLFLLNVLNDKETVHLFLFTGGLRFLGSTILHTVCSAIIGAAWALAFYKKSINKILSLFSGLIIAVLLHTAFNFLIIVTGGQMMFVIMLVLWLSALGILFLFEMAKKVSSIS